MTGELRGTCDDLRRFRRNVQIPMYTSTSSPDLPWLDLNAVSRPKNPYGVDFHGTRQWLHLDHLLHSQDLSQCTHLLKLRVDANVWSPLNATLFDHVQPGTIYARSDHSFYAEREAFYDVFHDFYHRIFSEFVMASKYICTLRDARMCMACHRPTIPTSAQPCVAHAVLPIGGVTTRRPA